MNYAVEISQGLSDNTDGLDLSLRFERSERQHREARSSPRDMCFRVHRGDRTSRSIL